jgi:hypothetical protein
MTEATRDPFGPLGILLGYVNAILGIAVFIFGFRQITAVSEPSAFVVAAKGAVGDPISPQSMEPSP